MEFWHERKFENGRFQKTYVAIVFIGQLLFAKLSPKPKFQIPKGMYNHVTFENKSFKKFHQS